MVVIVMSIDENKAELIFQAAVGKILQSAMFTEVVACETR
jgi:hypothetical protein